MSSGYDRNKYMEIKKLYNLRKPKLNSIEIRKEIGERQMNYCMKESKIGKSAYN
jgi:hypothetical protein